MLAETIETYRSPLSELKMQLVDAFHKAFHFFQVLTSPLCQETQTVPLIADTLAASIYGRYIVIMQSAETEGRMKSAFLYPVPILTSVLEQ